jgi:hypothetical protein
VYAQIRKIKPTRRSVSGVFAFRTVDSIPFESTLERDFLFRMEFDQQVTKVIPQPTKIPFIGSNGQTYTYIPDFLVYYGEQKTVLVEVKPRTEIQEKWSWLKHKFRFALRYAKEREWSFRIYDESRIRDQTLANIKFLRPYKRMDISLEHSNALINTLIKVGPQPIHGLLTHLANVTTDPIDIDSYIWHLLSIGAIACDMNLSLDKTTVLWIPERQERPRLDD